LERGPCAKARICRESSPQCFMDRNLGAYLGTSRYTSCAAWRPNIGDRVTFRVGKPAEERMGVVTRRWLSKDTLNWMYEVRVGDKTYEIEGRDVTSIKRRERVNVLLPTPREEALTLIYGTRRSPPC